METMLATMKARTRHAILLPALLVVLGSLVQIPQIYFCPAMGALPKPCCSAEASDGMGGNCCRVISVDHSSFASASVSLPDLSEGPAPVVMPASCFIQPPQPVDFDLLLLDLARPSPTPVYIRLSSFLC